MKPRNMTSVANDVEKQECAFDGHRHYGVLFYLRRPGHGTDDAFTRGDRQGFQFGRRREVGEEGQRIFRAERYFGWRTFLPGQSEAGILLLPLTRTGYTKHRKVRLTDYMHGSLHRKARGKTFQRSLVSHLEMCSSLHFHFYGFFWLSPSQVWRRSSHMLYPHGALD